jgi:(p)ppGpp synthase/HD superfamily hydrolase
MTDAQLITSSAAFAADAHSGQVRQELNEPYIVHPLRVGMMAAKYELPAEAIAACHLHDVVEDTKVPMATLESLFPVPTVVLVKALTKWWRDGHTDEVVQASKRAYYDQILATPLAPTLKVLDRIDNVYDFAKMARMASGTHRWAQRYYKKTSLEFVPILEALSTDCPAIADRLRAHYAAAMSALEIAVQ